jgi:4-amino-4-deoxy-L-arabinose transferase-like glycosyltransferase
MNSLAGQFSAGRRWVVLFPVIVGALLIRVFLIFHFDTWHIVPGDDYFPYGFEAGRLARSLAEGGGFASPFHLPTGPSAWIAPGYPWMLSVLFRIFGVYSPGAALTAFLLNSLFAALTCLAIYDLGCAFFDEATGLVAAALFAILPASIYHTINSLWDATISTGLLTVLIILLVRLERGVAVKPIRLAVATGLLTGVLALFNPSCLSVYAVGLAWVLFRRRDQFRSLIPSFVILAALPVLVCLPWLIRNKLVLHQFTLKSNFGTELRTGNNPVALSIPTTEAMDLHPSTGEFDLYQKLGEVGYVQYCQREAIAFIRSNPGIFVRLTLRRIEVFWMGVDNSFMGNLKTRINWSIAKLVVSSSWSILALLGLIVGFRRDRHMLLLLALLVYPLPYYLTHTMNRYRLPIDPLLAILAAQFLVWSWKKFNPGASVAQTARVNS